MSAAASRAALASVGADLVALSGEPAERRGAALLMRLVDAPPADATIEDLKGVPEWLRRAREAQRRLALRVSLLSIAPALAHSIDGGWLRGVVALAGEEAVDWAMETAESIEGAEKTPVAVDAIEGRGFSLLRGQLAPSLRGFLGWAPTGEADCSPTVVAPWLDLALATEVA